MLVVKTMDAVLTVGFFMPPPPPLLLLPAVSSIRSTLEGHLEQKDCPPLLGLESLSEDITLAQGAEVWRAAVEFKRR